MTPLSFVTLVPEYGSLASYSASLPAAQEHRHFRVEFVVGLVRRTADRDKYHDHEGHAEHGERTGDYLCGEHVGALALRFDLSQ